MRWMEQCAFIAASRVGRGISLLTAGMDSIAFACPTRVGDTVYIEGQVSALEERKGVAFQISAWLSVLVCLGSVGDTVYMEGRASSACHSERVLHEISAL